jgi:hypothetical protein
MLSSVIAIVLLPRPGAAGPELESRLPNHEIGPKSEAGL